MFIHVPGNLLMKLLNHKTALPSQFDLNAGMIQEVDNNYDLNCIEDLYNVSLEDYTMTWI